MEACKHSLDWMDWIKVGLDAETVTQAHSKPLSKVAYALRDFLKEHRSKLECLYNIWAVA